MKAKTDFSNFAALDMRVGKIVSVADSKSKKPTYKIIVDFGNEIGKKTTIGAYKNYPKDALVGKLVVGLINAGEKRMGEEVSEFLMLGVANKKHETIYLTVESEVDLGAPVF